MGLAGRGHVSHVVAGHDGVRLRVRHAAGQAGVRGRGGRPRRGMVRVQVERRVRRLGRRRLCPRLVVGVAVVGQRGGGVRLVRAMRGEERRRRGGSGRRRRRAVGGGARARLQLVVAGGPLGRVGPGCADGPRRYLRGGVAVDGGYVGAVGPVWRVRAERRWRQCRGR